MLINLVQNGRLPLLRRCCATLICNSKRNVRGVSPRIENSTENKVVLNDNGSTIVCWHPEQDFPYEFSKPMPIIQPAIREEDSLVKLEHRTADLYPYQKTEDVMIRKRLMALTHTCKYLWFPKSYRRIQIKKLKNEKAPKDRDIL